MSYQVFHQGGLIGEVFDLTYESPSYSGRFTWTGPLPPYREFFAQIDTEEELPGELDEHFVEGWQLLVDNELQEICGFVVLRSLTVRNQYRAEFRMGS